MLNILNINKLVFTKMKEMKMTNLYKNDYL
jgi:hypothetical protein